MRREQKREEQMRRKREGKSQEELPKAAVPIGYNIKSKGY